MNARDIAAIELWVGNARQAVSYFTNAFGFALIGTARSEPSDGDSVSYFLQQREVQLIVTGATTRDSPVAEFVRHHGDGIRDIALTLSGASGERTIPAFGDTVHSLVSDTGSGDRFAVFRSHTEATLASHADPAGLVAVDHVAVSVNPGDRERCVARYEHELGFRGIGSPIEFVDIGASAFTMSSVRAHEGDATFVFAEPAEGQSQIADFLTEYGGPGVHHLAFATNDIVETATVLRARGVGTLRVPETYYQQARERLGTLDLPWDELESLGILVDRDDDGVLLQAFTDPIGDRSTLYFEVIQRVGATGFGTENIRALYHAVVLQQSP